MKNYTRHAEAQFTGAVLTQCRALGIDADSEAEFSIGGGGAIAPMVLNGELQGFGPTWVFMFSLRSKLLGMEPVAGSLPIHDVRPSDAAIEMTAKRLVNDVNAAREAQFKGE